MAKTKNSWHKNATHLKWWQLALITLVTFGGTVFATLSISGTNTCELLSSSGQSAGFICTKLDTTDSGSIQEIEFKEANKNSAVGNIKNDLIGKKLQFTNKSNKNYFVPFKYQKELDSFLAAKDRLNVHVCEPGISYDTSGSFAEYGIMGCDTAVETYAWEVSDWGACSTATTASCTGSWTEGNFYTQDPEFKTCTNNNNSPRSCDLKYVCGNDTCTTKSCSGPTTASACTSQNGACTFTAAGESTKTRTVTCKDSAGNTATDQTLCTETKPTTTSTNGCTNPGDKDDTGGTGGTGNTGAGAYWWECSFYGEDGQYMKTTNTCNVAIANTDKANAENCYLDAYTMRTDSICCLANDWPIVGDCGQDNGTDTGGTGTTGGTTTGGGGTTTGGTGTDGGSTEHGDKEEGPNAL